MIETIVRRRRALFGLVAVIGALHGCALPPSAAVYVYVSYPSVVLHGGAAQTLNIVIVGDGFTAEAASIGAYRAAADAFVTSLLAEPPFGAMSDAFSVYRVDVTSNQAGIDVPEACGPYKYAKPPASLDQFARTAPIARDSALSTTWCAPPATRSHLISSTDEPRVYDAAFSAGVVPDLVIVIVNDWMYGAAAWPQSPLGSGSGGILYVSINQNLTNEMHPVTSALLQSQDPTAYPAVAIHEVGHLGPFLLLDEYGNSTASIPYNEQTEIDNSPNLTSTLAPLKWEALKTPGSTLPTNCSQQPRPEAAAAPGGAGYASGVYHARCGCIMNQYWHDSFCVVCRQQFLTTLTPYAPPSPPNWKLRVLADSVLLERESSGYFFVTFKFSTSSSSSGGRWPGGDQNRLLTVGSTEEPGEVLFEVSSTSLPNSLDYQLWRTQSATGSQGARLVEQQSVSLGRPLRPGTRIARFDLASHRLTLGIIAR